MSYTDEDEERERYWRDFRYREVLQKVPYIEVSGLQQCLDKRVRTECDAHVAVSILEGYGPLLLFDPHSQVPRDQWLNGERPPGLRAHFYRRYSRMFFFEEMVLHDIDYLLVNHGSTGGEFWQRHFIENFADCNPKFLNGDDGITLIELPSDLASNRAEHKQHLVDSERQHREELEREGNEHELAKMRGVEVALSKLLG